MSRALKLTIAAAVALLLVPAVGRLVVSLKGDRRDGWTLWYVGTDTAVMMVRMSVSDLGFLDHALTTRVVYVEQQARTVQHRASWGPATEAGGGVEAGPDAIRLDPQGWRVKVGGPDLQVAGVLAGAVPETCPPTEGSFRGGLGLTPAQAVSPSGMVVSEGGTILRGPAVLTRTVANGEEEADALYVLGPDFAIGVDPLSACPAWGRAGELEWAGAAPERIDPKGELRVGPWTIRLGPAGPAVRVDPVAHLHPLERLAGRAFGLPYADQVVQRVSARVSGPGVDGPRTGVLLQRGPR